MRRILKYAGYTVGGLLGMVALAGAGVYGVSSARMAKTYEVEPAALEIPTDAASLERGRHVAVTRGCLDCHGADGSGTTMIDDPAIGRLMATNLTSGANGIGRSYTDADWVRAIRHGVRPDGKPLLFMPAQEFVHLGAEDLAALIGYLKTLPAVDTEPRENRVGPLGRVLYLAGQLPLLPVELIADHDAPIPTAPEPAPTAAYGEYLTTGCVGCHGANLSGGKIPGGPPDWPAAANLTPHESGLAGWTEADLFRALREGKRPDGSDIDPVMPWKLTGEMTDTELRAVWAYLSSLPPVPMGER